MPDITYDTIADNVGEVSTNGSSLEVQFKCAGSGDKVCDAKATMKKDTSVGGRVGASVKRGIWYEIKNFFVRIIGRSVGGAGGRIASRAAREGVRDVGNDAGYTESSKHNAIVEAFKSVQGQFEWNEEKKKYLAAAKKEE